MHLKYMRVPKPFIYHLIEKNKIITIKLLSTPIDNECRLRDVPVNKHKY